MAGRESNRELYERRVLAELRKWLLEERPAWCDASFAGRRIRIEANLQELVCASDLGLPHDREARGVRRIPD